MSLKPSLIEPVPEETARVARAVFPKGNPLLRLRDELGPIFADADFADLFPKRGQPGLWKFTRVTVSLPAMRSRSTMVIPFLLMT
jgi:transposase